MSEKRQTCSVCLLDYLHVQCEPEPPSCQASITHSVQETETMPVISVILKFSFLISGVRSGGFDPSHSYAAERFPMMHWACLLCVTTLHFTNFVSSLLVEFVLLPLCQMSLTLHCACLIFWSDLTMFIVHLFLLLIVYFSHCSLFFSSFTPTDGKPWAWRFLPVRLELLSPSPLPVLVPRVSISMARSWI